MQPNPGLDLKGLTKLGEELYALMQTAEGATAANIAKQPTLMGLRIAYDEARSSGSARPSQVAIAQVLRDLLKQMTYLLSSIQGGNNDEGVAARIYLALEPDSEALLLKDRRKQAEVYIPYTLRSAAKRHGPERTSFEKRLMQSVAGHLIDREFAHLDELARSHLVRADAWAPQPHAGIFNTYQSLESMVILLGSVQASNRFFCIVAKILNNNATQTEPLPPGTEQGPEYFAKAPERIMEKIYFMLAATVLTTGRLFLTADFVQASQLVEGQAEISRLSPREALVNLCTAIPVSMEDVEYLSSVYVDGREKCDYKPDVDPSISAVREPAEVIRWVFHQYSTAEWARVQELIEIWSSWANCDCRATRHIPGCRVAVAVHTLERYMETLEDAWQRLLAALTSPTLHGFAGWQDGRRLYHDLGLTPM
ncbi:MAG TPA: hypothetical protein VGG98_10020 [Solirubrobacteraceae bacterium]